MPNPWLIVAVLVVIAGAFTSGYFKGRHDMDLAYKAAALEAEKKVVKDVVAADTITETVAEKAEEKQVEIRTVTKEIIKWRTQNVPVEVDRKCAVPDGTISVLDAAARGTPIPDATGKPDGGASEIGLTAVTDSVVGNYGTCNGIRQTLIDLQDWIRREQALWAPQ